jgi:hypothetical protein
MPGLEMDLDATTFKSKSETARKLLKGVEEGKESLPALSSQHSIRL